MKIALNLRPLYPGRIGGLETYLCTLLDRWVLGGTARGIELVLFTNTANHDGFAHLAHAVERIKLPDAGYEQSAFDQLVRIRPEVYFCPFLTLEPLNPPVPSAVTIPDLQHEYFPEFFSAEILAWRRQAYAATVERAGCIFTPSEHSKRTFVEKLGADAGRIAVIPHDLDAVYGRPPDSAAITRVRQKHGLPEHYLYYPANFWPHKNHEALLRALARAGEALGDASLVFTGAPDERAGALGIRAQSLRIADRIRFAGYVPKEELPGFYGGARALVFPSLFEGYGIPIAEAFACGCPVACSDSTSCPEVAGDAALLFDPRRPEAIADAMVRICRDESLRAELIEKGRKVAAGLAGSREAEATLERLCRVAEDSRVFPVSSPSDLPTVTVITPSYNQGRFIEATIQSVLSQEYPNLEYWVIDGGSRDETPAILQACEDRLSWVSEKDAGQADAVNKGLTRATGEIIGWLNSDDTYLPGTLRHVGEFFQSHPEVDVVYGDASYADIDGSVLNPYPTRDYRWDTLAHECYICQPAVFFRRRLLGEVGLLDPRLHFALDYEYWMRLFRRHPPVRLRRFLATSRMYADNKTLSQRHGVYGEIFRTVRKHHGFVPYSWALGYASFRWHRNDQYHSPRPVTGLVVGLAILAMAWLNRSNPKYMWRWLTNRDTGMRSEVFRSMRAK